MLTINELRVIRDRLAENRTRMSLGDMLELSGAITDTTPADSEWFRELGAVAMTSDGRIVLCLHDVHYTPSATTSDFSRPWLGWEVFDAHADRIDPWQSPPTRGQVVMLLLATM